MNVNTMKSANKDHLSRGFTAHCDKLWRNQNKRCDIIINSVLFNINNISITGYKAMIILISRINCSHIR